MRVLVTGGAGFIGSNLVEALVDRGDQVVVLDDLSSGHPDAVHPTADLITGDVAEPSVVASAVEGCGLVLHHAAHRAVPLSVEEPLQTDRANVRGTLALLVAARDAGVGRVVLASSSSVYGNSSEFPTSETAPCMPCSPYAVSKLAGEHYSRVFWELFGLETVCLRYFNVYGPRQRPDARYAAVIPLFIDALRSGRSPEVNGDGLQGRDFTFVADAVAANLLAAKAPAEQCAGRAFNIAGGRSSTVLEILEMLQQTLSTTAAAVHTDPRPGDMRRSWADIGAATRDLGYRPTVGLAEGLARTIRWGAR